jgi:plastocyanin
VRIVGSAVGAALCVVAVLLVTSAPAAADASVSISGAGFSPTVVNITAGETVTWTNGDVAFHTVTSDDGSLFDGGTDPGATFSHTFTDAGTFTYHCVPHPFMVGSVVVAAAPPTTTTTTTTTTAPLSTPTSGPPSVAPTAVPAQPAGTLARTGAAVSPVELLALGIALVVAGYIVARRASTGSSVAARADG